MTTWHLSIDLGTTATAAAVARAGERRVLELDGSSSMPSTVLAPEQGSLVVGRAADAQAALEPERVERTPKRRLGDPVLLLGGRAVDPADAVAAILDHVRRIAVASFGGEAPAGVVLTHPARWGQSRLDLLREAARRAHLPEPALVPEPVAAAAHLAEDLARPGDLLAVYDLGGGTFDAVVVRRTASGFEVAGPPGGDENLGGEVFDDRIVADLLTTLPPGTVDAVAAGAERPWRQAGAALRQGARQAKEALSTAESYTWYVAPPVDAELTLTAGRLEALIEEPVVATVRALVDAIARSGLSADRLAAVVMVGGGARTPMVGRLLTQAAGRPPVTWGDPKAAVCLGALVAFESAPAERLATPSPPPPPAATPDPTGEPAPVVDGEVGEPTEPSEPEPPQPQRGEVITADPPPVSEPPERASDDAAPGAWDAARLGTFVAVLLVLLGVVSAILALLLS